MEILYELLRENNAIYKLFLELEYKKYEAVINNDIISLDDIVSDEEVYYLKMKNIEHKREKHLNSLGLKDMTLKEIMDSLEHEYKAILQEQYNELNNTIKELKKINSLLKTVVEVRLRRIDNDMKEKLCLDQLF